MPLIPSGVIIGRLSNTGIPAGWSRVAAMDGVYVKQIATSGTAPGAIGGSLTSHSHTYSAHTHTQGAHTHTGWPVSGASGNIGLFGQPGTVFAQGNHTHGFSSSASGGGNGGNSGGPANYDSATTEPPFITVIWIKSDGTPTGFPDLSLVFFNAAPPTGWARYTAADSKLLKGAAAGVDGGTTGGSSSHTHPSASHSHTINGHTHTMSYGIMSPYVTHGVAGSGGDSAPGHTHNGTTSSDATGSGGASEGSGGGDPNPPWQKSLLIQNASGGNSLPNNAIVLWDGALGSIPATYHLCDGTSGTPNWSGDKYVMASDSTGNIGATGGATTHTHPGVAHTHTVSHTHAGTTGDQIPGADALGNSSGPENLPGSSSHTHAIGSPSNDTTGLNSATPGTSGTATNAPTFIGVAFIQFQNTAPNAPTITTPTASSSWDRSITLAATTTDADGDTWFATFEYQVDGGAWNVIGDGTTAASGGSSSRVWDTSRLVPASATYKVRAKATDGNGAASAYTTMASPFTIHRPDFMGFGGAF